MKLVLWQPQTSLQPLRGDRSVIVDNGRRLVCGRCAGACSGWAAARAVEKSVKQMSFIPNSTTRAGHCAAAARPRGLSTHDHAPPLAAPGDGGGGRKGSLLPGGRGGSGLQEQDAHARSGQKQPKTQRFAKVRNNRSGQKQPTRRKQLALSHAEEAHAMQVGSEHAGQGFGRGQAGSRRTRESTARA